MSVDSFLHMQTAGILECRLPNTPEAWGLAVWVCHGAGQPGSAADDLAQRGRALGLRHRS